MLTPKTMNSFVSSRFYLKGLTWFPLVAMGMQSFLNLHSMSWPKYSCKDKVWKIGTLPASFQHSEIKCSCSQRTIRLDVTTYAKKNYRPGMGSVLSRDTPSSDFQLRWSHHTMITHYSEINEKRLGNSRRATGEEVCMDGRRQQKRGCSHGASNKHVRKQRTVLLPLIHGLRNTQVIKYADSF